MKKVTRSDIIDAANYYDKTRKCFGGYVTRDIEWINADNPTAFKSYLHSLGFTVISCIDTEYSWAVAVTVDGYCITYSGYCTLEV